MAYPENPQLYPKPPLTADNADFEASGTNAPPPNAQPNNSVDVRADKDVLGKIPVVNNSAPRVGQFTRNEPTGVRSSTQSFGQRLTRSTFNPSGLPDVDRIKKLSAELIDTIHTLRGNELVRANEATHGTNDNLKANEAARCYSIAITNLETACMYAVKGATS